MKHTFCRCRLALPRIPLAALLTVLLAATVVGPVAAAPVPDPYETAHREITRIVVQDILDGKTDGVRVVATPVPLEEGLQAELRWSGGEVTIPPRAVWLAVADETPGVMGYHPVRHVFLDSALEIVEVRDAVFYPRFYVEGRRLGLVTLVEFHAKPGRIPVDRELASSPATAGARSPEESFTYNNFYAVIIEGDVPSGPTTYPEFWTDPVQLFRILLEYGYQEDHIYVLYGEGHDEDNWNCSYYRETMVDYPAYKQDVRNIFTWMRDGNPEEGIAQVTADDFIFLFTFDHGGGSGCDSTLGLMDGSMSDTEFASYFNDIAYKHRAVDMQQCHSGGFVDNLENTNTVVSTAANCTESAWQADEEDTCDGYPVKYGEWNYWWMSAMRGHKPWPGEEPVDADANSDGTISFLEAHNYAAANDDRPEHPQWSDPGGIGDELSLNASWAGVHLVYDGHVLQDDTGNGDGLADAGETLTMPVTLFNNGDTNATAVIGTLRTDNAWVTIQDDSASFPDLPSGTGAESLPDHFLWFSDPETPNATEVEFFLDWDAGGGAYTGTTSFSETVIRTDLIVQSSSVDDGAGGDGDGIADPGESIRLEVTLRNKGDASVHGLHGVLSTASPWVSVTDDNASFPDIEGQGQGTSLPDHFGLDIDSATPERTWIHCTLDLTGDNGYRSSLPLKFMVGCRGTVLLVDDGDADNADLLETLVTSLGFGVDRQTAAATDPDSWTTYDILFWAAGANADPVYQVSWQDSLEQYVAGGGRLFIEGGELGRDHRYHDSFRSQVLHMATFSTDTGEDLDVLEETHPLATSPTILDETIPVHATQASETDVVNPTGDATAVLDWTAQSGRASLIAYDDDDLEGNGGQVVSLFVASDVIDDAGGQRSALVENVLTWLAGNDGPYLLYDGHVLTDDDSGNGNDDGIADPGETVRLAVNLVNRADGTATDTWARATTDASTLIAFADNFASWGDIAPRASVASDAPHFLLHIAEDAPCGTKVEITLHISTAEGFYGVRRFSFKIGTGGGQHLTLDSTDTPMDVPNAATADSAINAAGQYRVGDVNCHVEATHATAVDQLRIVLRSPSGTDVTLHNATGTSTTLNTTYDSQTQPDGPGAMSDFDGETATGAWHLLVTDLKQSPNANGRLDAWQLILDTDDACHQQTCAEPVPGAVGESLRMSRLSGTDVHLEWGAVAGAAGYTVWRSSSAGFTDPETSGDSTTTAYDEIGLPNGSRTYFYLVKARNACYEEGP